MGRTSADLGGRRQPVLSFFGKERERERFFCCRGKMPAAPPNVDSIRKAVEGSRRSANQSVVMSLRGLELVADDEKYVQDESEMEIPPGVDTPWSFGSFIRYFGPGWLVCIAYVDPGNYQADIQSGAQTGYSQNWVILWTQLLSWYVQYMCVKLQHYTNTNLAEAMALQYPKYVRWMFWVIAEVSIILFVEWDMSPTNSEDFLKGAFLPILPMTPGAIQSIIQIIGAVVMPHNLYLHSGALETRRCPPVDAYKRQAVKLGLWDPFIPILSTTVVNWAIASLAAIYVYGKNIRDADGLGIASFPKYLDVKGGTIMWGIALIAAAQSSCITTTYSGQFVMDGFLKINIPKWSRAIITRCVAVVPCVAVAAAFTNDTKALETMVDIVNSSLAFLLPFALIPLVKLTCSKQYMGEDYVAGMIETVVISLATLLCFGINFYTLVAPGGDYFGQYTSDMNIVGVQMNIVQDIVCIFYTACCVYMTFVPVRGSPLPIRKSLKPVEEEEEHAVAATDSMSDQKKAIVEMGKK